ncbi:NAD-dependent epimerase/dehydratase family protein [Chryseobacterium rhizoplanae]|uniref:NAD-dependent epimerase/dehydratase family protein n=1 Tax=Chryseobacterium rhizoplanae TaxID=1609531 RepID=UPI001CE35520|nr:NAD-dependent epimerase/dehydratase family protein [Chryseobacterium rhizoplanae]UCA61896.1 NAD-dependent epimerase/dehydratase family protein [Chryseobacterium rhizoplanae]
MKIALFGFSGFLGSYLLHHLTFEMISVNIRQTDWNKSISKDVEVFISLLGKAHDHKGVATENDYYFANVELTKHVFQEFVNSDSKLLIHISSIAAIEELEHKEPLKEQGDCNPTSIYGKTKREAEKWLLEQKLPENKKVVILRPPMIHGPGDKGNLGLLYKIILKGIPYPLASFDNSRSFLSVENFCFYISEIIKSNDKIESGIYHICDDEPVSTKKIIEIIKDITGKNTMNLSIPKSIIQTIAKIGDTLSLPLNTKRLQKMTSNLLVSNQKIKSELNITKMPLTAEEGLIKTIKGFQSK